MSDFNTEGFDEWWAENKKLYDGDSDLCALRAWQHQQQRIEELEARNAELEISLKADAKLFAKMQCQIDDLENNYSYQLAKKAVELYE